jgi:hypothetical protein
MFVFRDTNLAGVGMPRNETRPAAELGRLLRAWSAFARVAFVEGWRSQQFDTSSDDVEDFGELSSPARSVDEQALEALHCVQPVELG